MATGTKDLDLSKIWLFSTCSAKDLRTIRRALDEVVVPPDRILVEEGTIGREFFLIVDGQASVRRKGRRSATLGVVPPGKSATNFSSSDTPLKMYRHVVVIPSANGITPLPTPMTTTGQ